MENTIANHTLSFNNLKNKVIDEKQYIGNIAKMTDSNSYTLEYALLTSKRELVKRYRDDSITYERVVSGLCEDSSVIPTNELKDNLDKLGDLVNYINNYMMSKEHPIHLKGKDMSKVITMELYPDITQSEYLDISLQMKEYVWNSHHWYFVDYMDRQVMETTPIFAITDYSDELNSDKIALSVVSEDIRINTTNEFITQFVNYCKVGGEPIERMEETPNTLVFENTLLFTIHEDNLYLHRLDKLSVDGIHMEHKLDPGCIPKSITLIKNDDYWTMEITVVEEVS